MATPVTTAAEYCTLLVKSRLLPSEEVDAQYRQWQEEKPGPDERVDSFRRFLVARKSLTEYQAALVQRGRSDGFFLDGYKILDRIGKGQMGGGVYKAVHNFGQLVALKILPASRARNPHTLGRFQREARLLTQLDHPNVVRAFQVGESGNVHFIVMEYLEGETLADVLERRKRLTWAETLRLMVQVLDGLQHLHERRMVHRDLKPANIMLVPAPAQGKPDTTLEATVKVLDVGLGRELFDDLPDGQTDTQLTQEGSVLGTPDYLAPEQAKDARNADIRADIYSLGCVMYQCIAGRTPFPEPNIMAQMLKHATEKAAPLSTFAPDLPSGFQQVLDKFLAKSPDSRYQTPGEAAAALKPFTGSGPAAAAPKLTPAFKDWLDSESPPEAPKPRAQATGSGSAPAPALPTKPAAPGAAPKQAAPKAPAPKPTAAPQPVAASKPAAAPKAGTAPKPALAPKPGTAPTPALKSGSAARAVPAAVPVPLPVPVPVRAAEEFDVELVADPDTLTASAPDRPLWQPDRRDWIMLAAGAAGVLSSVGLGYGLARLLRRKPEPTEE